MIEHLRVIVEIYTLKKKLLPGTGFKVTESHSPLHLPIRYMQKDRGSASFIHPEARQASF